MSDSVAPKSSGSRAAALALRGVEIVGGLVCLATITAAGARLFWLFELAVHWRGAYLLGLITVAAVLGAARRPRRALVFAGFAVLNAWFVVPLHFGDERGTTSASLRVLLLNVNVGNMATERVARLVPESGADVVVLQEVDERWLAALELALAPYPHRVVEPRDTPYGIALFSRVELIGPEVVFLGDTLLPSIETGVRTPDGVLRLVTAHPTPPMGARLARQRDAQLKSLAQRVRGSRIPVLIVGDLNTTPFAPSFEDLLREGQLVDAGRGHGIVGTWPANWPALVRLPIDHVLHGDGLALTSFSVGPNVGSDHRPIVVDVGFTR